MTRTMKIAVVFALCLFLATTAFSQNVSTADLHGVVKDAKGSVVPNATVTIRDAARNFERTVKSAGDGTYNFRLLPPGSYTMSIQSPGMAKLLVKDLVLTVGQSAELPLAMSVEAGKTEITVSAENELVETAKTAVSNTIDSQRIDNLPINERNYIAFSLTTSTVDRDHGRPIGPAPTSGLNIGGQRGRSTVVSVDGADFTDTSVNAARTTLSQDAVQEFQVVTNSYAAEYGRASGGVINVVSKSGTNDWHGDLFGFIRSRYIQATNPFAPKTDPATGASGYKPPFTRTQYGASLGGAIIKDRTFIFLSVEQHRRQESGFFTSNPGSGMTSSVTIGNPYLPFVNPQVFNGLTPAQATAITNGLLSGNSTLTGAAIVYAYWASSGYNNALNGSTPQLSAGLGTIVPFGIQIGPRFILSGTPLPVSKNAFQPLNSLQKVFPVSEGSTLTSVRIDHRLNNKNQLVLRGGFNPSISTGIQPESQNQSLGQNDFSRTGIQGLRDINALAAVTTTLNNSLINEIRYNFGRRAASYVSQNGNAVADNIAGTAFTGTELFSPVHRVEKRHQVSDTVTWVKGNHTMKFGGDFNFINITAAFQLNFAGLFNFGGESPSDFCGFIGAAAPCVFSTFPNITAVQQYGLGTPSNFIQGFGNPNSGVTNYPVAFFGQDSWKMRRNLTLNYGVRYDIEFTPTIPPVGTTDPLSGVVLSASDILAAQDKMNVQQGFPLSKRNIAPRLGIAWDPMSDSKTIVRAGYGLFYDHPLQAIAFNSDIADASQQQQLVSLPGSPATSSFLNSWQIFQGTVCVPGAALTPVCAGAANVPSTVTPGTVCIPGTQANCAATLGVAGSAKYQFGQQRFNSATFPGFGPVLPFTLPVTKDFKYSYAHQLSMSIEHQIANNTTLTVGYLGVLGRHLPRPVDINAPNNNFLVQNYMRYTNGTAPLTVGQAQAISMPTQPAAVCSANPATSGCVQGLITIYPGLIAVNASGQVVVSPSAANFFRPNGPNYLLAIYQSQLVNAKSGGAVPVLNKAAFDALSACAGTPFAATCSPLLTPGPITPFGSMNAQSSNANSSYHALNVELKKRYSNNFTGTASYTWSHALDSSSDLQTLLLPQDNRNLGAEKSNSLFDQRHRFVLSGVVTSPRSWSDGSGLQKAFANMTLAPIGEVSSGRPFNIITNQDTNGDQSNQTDRPSVGPGGTLVLPAQFATGNLGRNMGLTTMYTSFDMRISRMFTLHERWHMDVIAEGFNLLNHTNEASASPFFVDVNTYAQTTGKYYRSTPTASYDPRQFQFGLKLHW